MINEMNVNRQFRKFRFLSITEDNQAWVIICDSHLKGKTIKDTSPYFTFFMPQGINMGSWQLVPKTTRAMANRTQVDSYAGQLAPTTTHTHDDLYPGQLVPKTTFTQDESYPAQVVPRTTRIQDKSYAWQVVRMTSLTWTNAFIMRQKM